MQLITSDEKDREQSKEILGLVLQGELPDTENRRELIRFLVRRYPAEAATLEKIRGRLRSREDDTQPPSTTA